MIQLYPSNSEEGFGEHEFEVSIDGIKKILEPGTVVRLHPGESITLCQGLYHKFYGQCGYGKVLVGEVSTVNNDHTDNHFYNQVGRFPEIEEDIPPVHLLASDFKHILL